MGMLMRWAIERDFIMLYEKDEHGTYRPATRVYESPEQEALRKRGEAEHGPNVAVRMNSRYQLEYYDKTTGQVVSCHY